MGEAIDPDWSDVRAKRMQLLKNSDSEIVDDMPRSKAKWQNYRQNYATGTSINDHAGISGSLQHGAH